MPSPITRRLGVTARTRALAQCVPRGTRVLVDVGTNHGILPIAVIRAGRALRCIAIDRSAAAIAEAARRVRRCRIGDRVELRHGCGLEPIGVSEAGIDVVCIAGVAGAPMAAILERGLSRLRPTGIRLVLNPIGSNATLRALLGANGFELSSESSVTERGRDYPILVAER